MPHIAEDKHYPIRVAEEYSTRTAKIAWERKKTNSDGHGTFTRPKGITYVYPTNTWEVGSQSRDPRGVVWQ